MKLITPKNYYDLVIVGGGPAGLTASAYAKKLGIDFLLIEKNNFPKDKICGDGLAPIVFNILDELSIPWNSSKDLFAIKEVEFVFSNKDEKVSFGNKNIANSRTYNCRRYFFDDLIKDKGVDENSILYAEVKSINGSENCLSYCQGALLEKIHYKNLLLCTGSGKCIFQDEHNTAFENISFASRAYIEVNTPVYKNYFEFFEEISPGYFWIFPVTDNLVNTGIYIQNNMHVSRLYEIHNKKLYEHFKLESPPQFKRWPLRTYPHRNQLKFDNIALIGDAYHSVDPLFGHGIDIAMLQAREQLKSIKQTGRLLVSSEIYDEIEKLGESSMNYKSILTEPLALEIKKNEFQKFLKATSLFYTNVKNLMAQNPLDHTNYQNLNSSKEKVEELTNQLTNAGYAIIDFLNKEELAELEKIIQSFKFSFSNNLNREKLKFNSSFFESDSELKLQFYKKISEFFLPKINFILDDYDILITNYWSKQPSDGEVLVHQNWSHVDESKFRSYSIWIPLQNSDKSNGTIEVIPKSHQLFTEPRGINMEYPFESMFKAIGKEIKAEYLLPVNLRIGQAVIFDDALIHYTGPNQSDKIRHAIQLIIKPRKAKGKFYFKHKNIDGANNVEVFDADANFYINLKLITGGNFRPTHGISKEFITHKAEKMTMDKFRAIMKNSHCIQGAINTENSFNNVLSNFLSIAKRIKRIVLHTY